ncbi:MAG: MBL fold metallo-hydrolase [Candidatus Altiarchaeota archaeon]|nr:MBL fold metallo-hydrolase [Candidatus Altiarchaeota archaeon]
MHSLTFLGTGGGRFVLLSQRRYSGGIWLDFGTKILLDPGPGALVRAHQFKKKPQELDAVLVSHKHLDHYNDAEVMIEAMTYGTKKKKGILAINKNALEYISEYHQKAVTVIVPKPGEVFTVENIKVKALPTFKHEEGIGFRFITEAGVLTYSSDTGYSEKLIYGYKDSKILLLNVIFPRTKALESHLNTEDAARIIGDVKPELAIIQHFGTAMLNAGPEKEAAFIEEKTGVKTMAARDGMTVDVETLRTEERQLRLSGF